MPSSLISKFWPDLGCTSIISIAKTKGLISNREADIKIWIVQQIVEQTMSSKTTVKRYLKEAGIALRREDLKLGPPSYGERKVNGRMIKNKAELELMQKIKALHGKGMSATQIAQLLNNLALPTKLGGRWHAKTIIFILKQLTGK